MNLTALMSVFAAVYRRTASPTCTICTIAHVQPPVLSLKYELYLIRGQRVQRVLERRYLRASGLLNGRRRSGGFILDGHNELWICVRGKQRVDAGRSQARWGVRSGGSVSLYGDALQVMLLVSCRKPDLPGEEV